MSATHEPNDRPVPTGDEAARRPRRRIPVPPIPRQRPATPAAPGAADRPYAATAPTQPIPLARVPHPRRPAD